MCRATSQVKCYNEMHCQEVSALAGQRAGEGGCGVWLGERVNGPPPATKLRGGLGEGGRAGESRPSINIGVHLSGGATQAGVTAGATPGRI